MSVNVSTAELSENSIISFAPAPPGQFVEFTHYKEGNAAIDYIEYQPLAGYGVILCTSGEYTYTEVQPMFLGEDCALMAAAGYVESHTEPISTLIVDDAPAPRGRFRERTVRP